MLEVRHISVHYGDVQAVKDVSLRVEEGSIAVLLGPNAAGKSTTLRAISGILAVRSGEIVLDGEPNPQPRPRTRSWSEGSSTCRKGEVSSAR